MDVSWIKIYIDWYDSRKIKYLRKLPKGNEYALLWIMVLSLAGKSNNGGKLSITDDLPYALEDLANELGFKAQIVKQGFSEFLKLGMVIQEDDFYIIANWEEYQNADKMAEIREYNRQKQRESRARRKNVNDMSMTSQDDCQGCQDTEKEKEIDKELDIDDISNNKLINRLSVDEMKFLDGMCQEAGSNLKQLIRYTEAKKTDERIEDPFKYLMGVLTKDKGWNYAN